MDKALTWNIVVLDLAFWEVLAAGRAALLQASFLAFVHVTLPT